MTNYLANTLSF